MTRNGSLTSFFAVDIYPTVEVLKPARFVISVDWRDLPISCDLKVLNAVNAHRTMLNKELNGIYFRYARKSRRVN